MTDLVPSHARRVDVKGGERTWTAQGVRTRIVLDTSVLVADPSCLAQLRRRRRGDPADRRRGARQPEDPVDDVGRAARTALRTIEELRVERRRLAGRAGAGRRRRRGTLQIEINGVQKHLLVEHGLDPTLPDNRIIGAALGQADARADARWCRTTPRCGSRPPTSASAAAEHQPGRAQRSDTAGGLGARSTPTHEPIDCLYAAGAIDVDAVAGDATGSRTRTSSPCCAAGSQSALARRVGDELGAAAARRARGVGAAAALQGAAVRARAAARPRRQRRRPRRPGRHRQDAAGHRRRARAGRRAARATSGSPSTARSCRWAGPMSASCPAASTRSSTRGCRRSTTRSSPSPTSAAAATPAA